MFGFSSSRRHNRIRESFSDRVVYCITILVMILVLIITLYPFLYVLSMSLSLSLIHI